jgi:hypothetical protein
MMAWRSSSVSGGDPAGGMRFGMGTLPTRSHGRAVFLPRIAQTSRLVRALPGSM